MSVDLDKLALHTSYNTYKNNSVKRGNLALPTTLGAGATWTSTLTLTLSEAAPFIQAYSYGTDYGDYFNYLDSLYHDAWRVINQNADYLLFSSSGLQFYKINMVLNGTSVTFTLIHKNIGGGTLTYRHDTYLVPVTLIDYKLAN